MGYKTSSLLCLIVLLAISSTTHGLLDITSMLKDYPQFQKFNNYLTETKLTNQINRRKTITVLALDDDAISSLEKKSLDTIEAILSVHILLDYFDEKRLLIAEGAHTQITTLFQTSGLATYDQGFVYVGLINEGELAFASGVKGSNYTAKLVKTVDTVPFTISILQVTEPIIPPGIEESLKALPTPPPLSASPPAPEDETVDARSPEESSEAPESAESPEAHAPKAAPASSGSRAQMGLIGAVIILASIFFSL